MSADQRRLRVLQRHLSPNEANADGPWGATGWSSRLRAVVEPKADETAANKRSDETLWDERIRRIEATKQFALGLGGAEAVKRQHSRGRKTIRERIDLLLDPGSFREVGALAGQGEADDEGRLNVFTPGNYVLGTGLIAGRPCVVGGEDFTIAGGSPNLAGLRKGRYMELLAMKHRVPLIRLIEGAGGSVTGAGGKKAAASRPTGEPVYSGHQFRNIAKCMQEVPVVAAALGAVAGLPAAKFVASHYAVMVRTAQAL